MYSLSADTFAAESGALASQGSARITLTATSSWTRAFEHSATVGAQINDTAPANNSVVFRGLWDDFQR